MKYWLLCIWVLACSCGGRQRDYQPAENALDAGRQYIDACLKGDFSRAAFFMQRGAVSERRLAEEEQAYRQKDKEGRQQYRTASININEVRELSPDTTLIRYSNTVDKIQETIRVIRNNDKWLVDIPAKDGTIH